MSLVAVHADDDRAEILTDTLACTVGYFTHAGRFRAVTFDCEQDFAPVDVEGL